MNIRDLQYLIAVHDLKNFSKAAERCFVSQPTLSGQLKKLEQELGSVLMERSTRKVIFTQLGEEVVAKARETLFSVDQIKSLAKQHQDPLSGDFHIGLIPTVGPYLLPLIMSMLNKEFPKVNFYLYELQTEKLIVKLLVGKLDIGILAKLDWDYPLIEYPLYKEKFKLAVSQDDPIAAGPNKVDQAVLDGRAVLMLEDGHCLRDQALGVCFSSGAKEDQRYQATSMDTLLHMVAAGAGMTLVPELVCQQPMTNVTYLDFKKPAPDREIILVSRKNSVRLDLIKKIESLISQQVELTM